MQNISRSFLLAASLLLAVVFTAAALAVLSASATAAAAAASAVSSVPGFVWQDDFSSSQLNSRWSWLDEDPAYWSLSDRPGYLIITTTSVVSPVMNILVSKAPVGDFEIEAHLYFTPTQNFQTAGLLVYQDNDNFLVAGRSFCSIPVYCVGNGIYFEYIQNGSPTIDNFHTTISSQSEAYLKISREGSVYTAYASVDGLAWTALGPLNSAIKPTRIGLVTSNLNEGAGEIPAVFDNFKLVDQSFRLHLPVIAR